MWLDPSVTALVFRAQPRGPVSPNGLSAAVREVWLFDPGTEPAGDVLSVSNARLAVWLAEHVPAAIARIHTPETFNREEWQHFNFGGEVAIKVRSEQEAADLVALLNSIPDGVDYAVPAPDPCSINVGGGITLECELSRQRARERVDVEPLRRRWSK